MKEYSVLFSLSSLQLKPIYITFCVGVKSLELIRLTFSQTESPLLHKTWKCLYVRHSSFFSLSWKYCRKSKILNSLLKKMVWVWNKKKINKSLYLYYFPATSTRENRVKCNQIVFLSKFFIPTDDYEKTKQLGFS